MFFSGLKAPLDTLLAQTLIENILVEIVKQNSNDEKTSTHSSALITERERDALHYLGGYVISKLFKKVNKLRNNSAESYHCFDFIFCKSPRLLSYEVSGCFRLCKITPESENIFLIAERVFVTTSEKLLRKIDTNEMVGTWIWS